MAGSKQLQSSFSGFSEQFQSSFSAVSVVNQLGWMINDFGTIEMSNGNVAIDTAAVHCSI